MSRTSSPATTGPVRLGAQTRAAVRPTAAPAVTGGFGYERRDVNARVGIAQDPRMPESAGNLDNLRLVAGKAECGFRGDHPFQDTDVGEWLEAASWQLAQDAIARRDSAALNAEVDRVITLVAEAQQDDGYLNTWFQSGRGDGRHSDLRWDHDPYELPNVMRLLAGLEHDLTSTDGHGLQIHQYTSGVFHGDADGAPIGVSVDTEYPWRGGTAVTVERAPGMPWTLSPRIPQWWAEYTLGGVAEVEDGWLRIHRSWAAGDAIVLDLDLTPRLVSADPRVDAVRGCVAIERGPLVCCLEQADHPGGGLEDVVIDAASPLTVKERPDLLGAPTRSS